jgi:hypothetical protein
MMRDDDDDSSFPIPDTDTTNDREIVARVWSEERSVRTILAD